MHLVCDFDSTLFDTNQLWFAWLEILVARGVDRDLANQQMEILNALGFTHRAHALASGISESEVDALVQDFLQHARNIGPQLVYDDVAPFFDKHKDQHEFSILTYGNARYQHSKIVSTGLQKYFDTIRIADPNNLKVDHLKDLLARTPSLQRRGQGEVCDIAFVDDSPNELNPIVAAGLPITLYRIVRPGGKNDYVHEKDDVAWKRITSMNEIIL